MDINKQLPKFAAWTYVERNKSVGSFGRANEIVYTSCNSEEVHAYVQCYAVEKAMGWCFTRFGSQRVAGVYVDNFAAAAYEENRIYLVGASNEDLFGIFVSCKGAIFHASRS